MLFLLRKNLKLITLFLGPLLFAFILSLDTSDTSIRVIAIITWMVSWWIWEPIPIPATALLPICLFPLFNILDIKATTISYANPIVFLFLGGFIIALAMEKHKLHKRIALTLIKMTGTSPKGIVLGFMLSTAILSMWLSNTATTLMMLPVALSISELFANDKYFQLPQKQKKNLSLVLFLSIAYAANIGGIATIIGTPPNLILVNIVQELYGIELDFRKWMLAGLPISLGLLAIAFFYLTAKISSHQAPMPHVNLLIKQELQKLGKLSRPEKYIIAIFLFTVCLWIFKQPINQTLSLKLNDTIIAIAGALLMFCTPCEFRNTKFILNWTDSQKLPWGIIILFGGGLSIAKGMQSSGLVQKIADALLSYSGQNPWLLLLLFTAATLLMTELISNVALTTILLPIVLNISQMLHLPIFYLALPVTLAASCAFMMPISTPPNAIIFSSGTIKITDMLRKGLTLNLVAILVIAVLCHFISGLIV